MRLLRLRLLIVVLPALALGGCASMEVEPYAALHSSSPVEPGGGVRVTGLSPIGENGLLAGPVGSVSYLRWSGGGGRDLLFELSAQVRKPLGMGERAAWIGGEAGFAHMRSSAESGFEPESASGWSGWVHAGTPITRTVDVFVGVGVTGLWGGYGKNARIGVAIHP